MLLNNSKNKKTSVENNNNGYLNKCNVVELPYNKEHQLAVPHKRKSTFEILSHKENGFKDGYWINYASRKNQIYF